MTKHSPVRGGSLLERAAEIYDFGAALAGAPATKPVDVPQSEDVPRPETLIVDDDQRPIQAKPPIARPGLARIDREVLREAGFIDPEAPVGGLAEEFRIVKRQLLTAIKEGASLPEDKKQAILVCSAQPNEGKTFCAINLALSLAGERDLEVLLVDGDFNKPEIFKTFGVDAGPGLIDALADPGADIEQFVVETDIRGLSLLSAGREANNVSELLASARTTDVLADLARNHPRRIILFDSPPALMASPAAVLAAHVGQLMMVVRADHTTESNLRQAVALLSACDSINLLLNGEAFAANGRRFGTYYGYGE